MTIESAGPKLTYLTSLSFLKSPSNWPSHPDHNDLTSLLTVVVSSNHEIPVGFSSQVLSHDSHDLTVSRILFGAFNRREVINYCPLNQCQEEVPRYVEWWVRDACESMGLGFSFLHMRSDHLRCRNLPNLNCLRTIVSACPQLTYLTSLLHSSSLHQTDHHIADHNDLMTVTVTVSSNLQILSRLFASSPVTSHCVENSVWYLQKERGDYCPLNQCQEEVPRHVELWVRDACELMGLGFSFHMRSDHLRCKKFPNLNCLSDDRVCRSTTNLPNLSLAFPKSPSNWPSHLRSQRLDVFAN